ncbi:MAG: hypothetical protein P1V35_13255, partial [Planctomycetota bacterium]|nr:hypothetical protein [Planctomycetota bacterium]
MSIRRPGPPSRHWAKPVGLSVSIHLAALAAIPALLGLGVFALTRGEPRPAPKVHELRFETARRGPSTPERGDPIPMEDPQPEPIPEPLEDWPVSEESLDDLLPEPKDLDQRPLDESMPPLATLPDPAPETDASEEPEAPETEGTQEADPTPEADPVQEPVPVEPSE